jgi:hypothetical protein
MVKICLKVQDVSQWEENFSRKKYENDENFFEF